MSLNTEMILDAVKDLREKSGARKFSQSIELIINLRDIDPKKQESKIQENIELPYTPKKKKKTCVIADGELALKARKANTDLVLGTGDLEALATDKKRQKQIAATHDIFFAEASLMPLVGRTLGSTLGPRGKMPKPIPPNVNLKEQILRLSKTINVRMRSQPTLQCSVGTEENPDEEIAENILAVIRRVEGRLKRGLKNISTIYLKTSMGSPVKINL
jgi:large subunit ribosomal protein L1